MNECRQYGSVSFKRQIKLQIIEWAFGMMYWVTLVSPDF